MKVLVLSSQAANTGSCLRAFYIYKHIKEAGADAYYIKPPFDAMPFMADFLFSMFYYAFILLNRRYDYVIIVKPYPNTVIPALLLRFSGAKIIIDIDDLDHGYRAGPIAFITERIQSACCKSADIFTTHNSLLLKKINIMAEKQGKKVYMLKQCVDTSFFRPGVKKDRSMECERKKRGEPFLFYMAHLNIAGYLDEILEAFSMMKKKATLVVAGGGPMFGGYIKKVSRAGLQGRVIFTGPVTPQQAASAASACDLCLVYYSDADVNRHRASMKLREYLAMNLPVVATNVGEISSFSDFVYTCKPAAGAFAAELDKRIINLDKREKKGYKFISEKYNWGIEMKKFLKALKGVEIGQ